jgi:hypothetical protein
MRAMTMDPMIARTSVGREPEMQQDERRLHDAVVREAARQFAAAPWRLVTNDPVKRIYGVAEGLYPDLVALDGTDTGVAWILEVETPTTLAADASWLRLRRAAETGHHFILMVPSGYAEVTERLAVRLGFTFGFVYEYALASGDLSIETPRYAGAAAPA